MTVRLVRRRDISCGHWLSLTSVVCSPGSYHLSWIPPLLTPPPFFLLLFWSLLLKISVTQPFRESTDGWMNQSKSPFYREDMAEGIPHLFRKVVPRGRMYPPFLIWRMDVSLTRYSRATSFRWLEVPLFPYLCVRTGVPRQMLRRLLKLVVTLKGRR